VGTDGVDLGDVFGNGQQVADGAEGLAPEVHVQARNDDPFASVGEFDDVVNDLHFEELGFVEADDSDVVWDIQQLAGVGDGGGKQRILVVRDNLSLPITGIDFGLENLYVLARNAGPFHPTDQFFGLTREHTSADYFYPAGALATEMGFKEH
jgi:hypothetical protein